MVTAAGNEEKYGTGFKILKQAGIGLVFIGLAWFVVSIIFFLLNLVTQ
jgi:preprotein translocase subunit Sss1